MFKGFIQKAQHLLRFINRFTQVKQVQNRLMLNSSLGDVGRDKCHDQDVADGLAWEGSLCPDLHTTCAYTIYGCMHGLNMPDFSANFAKKTLPSVTTLGRTLGIFWMSWMTVTMFYPFYFDIHEYKCVWVLECFSFVVLHGPNNKSAISSENSIKIWNHVYYIFLLCHNECINN